MATARGQGAIGIVRLSGPAATTIGASVLGRPGLPPRRVCHGWARAVDGTVIDEVLALSMPGPSSFTGEDVVELHGHGGGAVEELLDAVLARGARLARPGEFTERAFANGRIDLVQAEAVCELIAASGARARHAAVRRLAGGLSRRLAALLEQIVACRAEVEGALDFPDDIPLPHLDLDDVLQTIRGLVSSYRTGRVLQDGALVVLAGAPNVGKSSLFNALLGEQRALVSPVPHTTRDFIEARTVWDGMVIRLVDTAGDGPATTDIESQAVEMSRDIARGSDLLLTIVDTPLPSSTSSPSAVLVANKSDLWPERPEGLIAVSARTGEGLEGLKATITRRLAGTGEEELIVSRRQHELLVQAETEVVSAAAATTLDLVAQHLRVLGELVGEVVGRSVDEEVLATVFARFCVGK